MLDYFYPDDERRFFTDREHHLALLEMSAERLMQGERQHLALAGLRRIGKSLILKEFLRRQHDAASAPTVPGGRAAVAYIDLQRLPLIPERFAGQYVGQLLYWFDDNPSAPFELHDDPAWQMATVAVLGRPALTDYLLTLHRELQRERPDQHRLLELAFNWPEVWSRNVDRRAIVLLDEFPEILRLDNFPQVGSVAGLFRAVLQSQSRVCYVTAGSMLNLMERLFLHSDSPLFVHFRLETVGLLDTPAADALARARLLAGGASPEQVTPQILSAVYHVTRGHPFYIYAVTLRLIEMMAVLHQPLTAESVQAAFVLEALSPTGRIYSLCRYILEVSLQRARGETIPQAVLQVLAREAQGMTLTQVARAIRRPTGAIRQILQWLIEVDLVAQDPDKRYSFRDPVLHIWAGYYYAGIELAGMPGPRALEALVADVMARYQRVSTELGLAKESQVREMLARLAGHTVDGTLLGRTGTTTIPAFRRVAPYRSPDGQVEIDALAENGERWAVEIKWRGKAVGLSEIRGLGEKARAVGAVAWCISRSGFTPDAMAEARRISMMVSSQADVVALAAIAGRYESPVETPSPGGAKPDD